jgi:hypothetical protein
MGMMVYVSVRADGIRIRVIDLITRGFVSMAHKDAGARAHTSVWGRCGLTDKTKSAATPRHKVLRRVLKGGSGPDLQQRARETIRVSISRLTVESLARVHIIVSKEKVRFARKMLVLVSKIFDKPDRMLGFGILDVCVVHKRTRLHHGCGTTRPGAHIETHYLCE